MTASSKDLESATVKVTAKASEEAEETHIESFEYSRVFYVRLEKKPVLPAKSQRQITLMEHQKRLM